MNPKIPLRPLGPNGLQVPPIGLGTWAMGGFLWGGTDEKKSREAILVSMEQGISLIDTAPIYGFGLSEEIVGSTLKEQGLRDKVFLATKCGLEWSDDQKHIRRNASAPRIQQEIEDSLRRLQTDYIDLYQIHWPDQNSSCEETMSCLQRLKDVGKIRGIGVSNYSKEQIEECLKFVSLDSDQPPYNLFERGVEKDVLPTCREHKIGTLTYGALCRGLLGGRYAKDATFPQGDLRRWDPKFKPDKFPQYLKAVERLKKLAEQKECSVAQLAIAWTAQQPGVSCALVGARDSKQAKENAGAAGFTFSENELKEIERILSIEIKTPVGPEFIAPVL